MRNADHIGSQIFACQQWAGQLGNQMFMKTVRIVYQVQREPVFDACTSGAYMITTEADLPRSGDKKTSDNTYEVLGMWHELCGCRIATNVFGSLCRLSRTGR